MQIVDEFDHFVVPVDDLVAAEDFYTRVFGGKVMARSGLSVKHQQLNIPPHTFVQIAGKRFGIFLQTEYRPTPPEVRGSPTYSFETTEAGIAETAGILRDSSARWDGPFEEDRPFAARSVYFTDPAGNHFHVYVPSEPRDDPSAGAADHIRALGYLELEAPNLEASVRFYEQALGLELIGYGEDWRGLRQANLRLPSSQLIFLTETDFAPKGLVMSRLVYGPHLGFLVRRARWDEAIADFDALGIANADRGGEWKRTTPDSGSGTYMDEPGGSVVQFITESGK